MQLFLHIGTNKTGSSFLQTMLGRNRALLHKNGIFFPVAEREEDMLAGKISPGNGGQLCRQLVLGNAQGAGNFLKSLLNDATRSGCTSVLISNEKLVRALSHPNALSTMAQRAFEAGFTGIKALLVCREPVDHALSLYQHRAKEGDHSNFDQWLSEDYETIRMFENFLPQLHLLQHPVEWTFRKYASSPAKMLAMLFTDWLQVPAPDVNSLPAVNPSLSLSEIQILQLFRKQHILALKPAKAAFDRLSKKQKADDRSLREHLRYKAFGFINAQRGVFDQINTRLPEGEKLELSPEPLPAGNPEACFSAGQLQAIIMATKAASAQSYRLRETVAGGVKMARKKFFARPKLRDMYNLEP